MANSIDLELNPADFITIGTIGPKGQRVFHLQAGKGEQIVTLVIEKEQAWALSEAINDLIDRLNEEKPDYDPNDISDWDMDLREPIRPMFRVAQLAVGLDDQDESMVLVAQELPRLENAEADPSVVRIWCNRDQMRALSAQAMETVQAGRANPKQNGRLVYYWT